MGSNHDLPTTCLQEEARLLKEERAREARRLEEEAFRKAKEDERRRREEAEMALAMRIQRLTKLLERTGHVFYKKAVRHRFHPFH